VTGRLSHRGTWIACHLIMALGVIVPLVVPVGGNHGGGPPGGGTFVVITMAACRKREGQGRTRVR